MLYEGSAIAAGRAVGLVVAIGRDTEAGRSAAAASSPPASGVEVRLAGLTRLTVPVTVASGALVTGLGFLYRRPARDAVGTGVALTVAAVPEGLPMLATIAQVAAARRLATRNVLVRNPRALEALGRADQVCFDKTGTLTHGAISLVCVSDGAREERLDGLGGRGRAVLAAALRATPVVEGDSVLPHATDRAIVAGAIEARVADGDGVESWDRIDEIPFESRRSYHAVLGTVGNGDSLVTVKGAPEAVVSLADTWRRNGAAVSLDTSVRRELEDHVERLGRTGLRVLAVAETCANGSTGLGDGTDIGGLELLGFVAFADLVRPTAAAAVRDLEAAGVRVAMITGDHPSTAEAIAAELGLLETGRVLAGSDLDQLTDEEFDEVLSEIAVFARVTPLQKVRIVEAYQRAGRSVAMTGDGANDAAAIRLADAGIALGGRGTAAARAAADVVVVDDRIETIVDSITEGRAMWDSVRDAVAILVGGNLGEVGFILVGAAVTGTSPLNPRQLLLVNLLTDMAPALAIALREPPDRTTETLLHAGPDASLGDALTRQIAIRAGATATGASAAWIVARMTGTPIRARTVALAALVGTQLGQTMLVGGRSPLVLGGDRGECRRARRRDRDARGEPVLRMPATGTGWLVDCGRRRRPARPRRRWLRRGHLRRLGDRIPRVRASRRGSALLTELESTGAELRAGPVTRDQHADAHERRRPADRSRRARRRREDRPKTPRRRGSPARACGRRAARNRPTVSPRQSVAWACRPWPYRPWRCRPWRSRPRRSRPWPRGPWPRGPWSWSL